MITTIAQFVEACKQLTVITPDTIYDMFEQECTQTVRDVIYELSEDNCNEPTRSALNALGELHGVQCLIDY